MDNRQILQIPESVYHPAARGGATLLRRAADIARSPSLFIDQVRQHTNAGRIEPRSLEGRRSLELVEDRGPIQTARKAG
jgi:hypothetical protein